MRFESASRNSTSRSKSASAFLWYVSNSISRFFLEDVTFSSSINNVSLSSRNFSASVSSERFDSSCSVKFLISNAIARCSTRSSSFSLEAFSFNSSNCISKESFRSFTEASSSSITFFSLLAISEASESFDSKALALDAYSEFFSSKLWISSNFLPSIDFISRTNSSILFSISNFCAEKLSLAFTKRLSASISFDSVSACAESAAFSFSSCVKLASSEDDWRRSNASVASAARVVAISASFSSLATRWLKAIISSLIFCPSADKVSISSRDLDSIVFNAFIASSFVLIASSISAAFTANSLFNFSISDCKISSLFIFSLKRLSRSEISPLSLSSRREFSSFKPFKDALSSCNSFSICVITIFIEFNSDSRDACVCRKDSRASSKSFCNFAFFAKDSSTVRFISASATAALFAAACSLLLNESFISSSFLFISFVSFFCSLRARSSWAFTSFASSSLRFASSASFSFSAFASSSSDFTFLASESVTASFAFTPFNSFRNSTNCSWDTTFCEEEVGDDGCAFVVVALLFKAPSGCVIAAYTSGVLNLHGSAAVCSSLAKDDCSEDNCSTAEDDVSIAFTFSNVSKTGSKYPRRVEMASTGTEATNIAVPALKTGAGLFVAWTWTCFFNFFFCCCRCRCRCSFSAFWNNFSSFSRPRRSFSSSIRARFCLSSPLFRCRSCLLLLLLLCCCCCCESTAAGTFSRTSSYASSFARCCSCSCCLSTCTTTRSPGNTKSKSTPGFRAFSTETSTPTYSESISTVSPGLNV